MINYNTQRLVFTKSNRSLIEDMIAYFTLKTTETPRINGINEVHHNTVSTVVTELEENLNFILELNKCLIEHDIGWTGNVDIDSGLVMQASLIYTKNENIELHHILVEDFIYHGENSIKKEVIDNILFISYSNTSSSIYFITKNLLEVIFANEGVAENY